MSRMRFLISSGRDALQGQGVYAEELEEVVHPGISVILRELTKSKAVRSMVNSSFEVAGLGRCERTARLAPAVDGPGLSLSWCRRLH